MLVAVGYLLIRARLNMLSYAVKTLQKKRAQVYLDAGHSNWVPAGQMARPACEPPMSLRPMGSP